MSYKTPANVDWEVWEPSMNVAFITGTAIYDVKECPACNGLTFTEHEGDGNNPQ